jgi:branched-chain amino acid transport system permease protein
MTIRNALTAGVVGLLVLSLPAWSDAYHLNITSQILIFGIFATGLNVLVGYAGLVSLGHASLFGFAAYVLAISLEHGASHLAAILISIGLTALCTGLFAVLSLRSRGITFIMITLALGQLLWGLAYRWVSFTHGDNGVRLDSRPSPFGLSLEAASEFYFLTLLVFLLATLAVLAFRNSAFGAVLVGTRDQPRRMTALGYDVWSIRFFSFLFSGLLSAVAGILFAYLHYFVDPHSLALTSSAEALLMVISGGAGTVLGPLAGAGLVVIMKNVASGYIERWNFALGLIFVLIVVFMPEGLVPGTRRLLRKIRQNWGGAIFHRGVEVPQWPH